VFAAQRQLYVHPYRHTRWCFLTIADNPTRFGGRAGSPIPLLDVQIVKNTTVPLPLLDRTGHEATPDYPQFSNGLAEGPFWVQPPNNDAERRLLPGLTAVLAAICDAVAKDLR
jgi:hypothetical protein